METLRRLGETRHSVADIICNPCFLSQRSPSKKTKKADEKKDIRVPATDVGPDKEDTGICLARGLRSEVVLEIIVVAMGDKRSQV